jgi:hypothetical protein
VMVVPFQKELFLLLTSVRIHSLTSETVRICP